MKIFCKCGYVISDNTDYLPYKARFIADEDYFELMSVLEGVVTKLANTIWSNSEVDRAELLRRAHTGLWRHLSSFYRLMYQCPACGRLYVDKLDRAANPEPFVPTEENPTKDLLKSILGDPRNHLHGYWKEHKNFGTGILIYQDKREEFDSWENLRSRFYRVYEELRRTKSVKIARLEKDDGKVTELIYYWRADSDAPHINNDPRQLY
ncbi:MAG: hypothetical protein F9K46_14410 [Anaerolineae bacterium]|nr:MAG: hypothetical protein F9K46_14410 [Anaerolineae bacterium]